MPLPGHRGLKILLASSLLMVSVAACGADGNTSPGPRGLTGDGDDPDDGDGDDNDDDDQEGGEFGDGDNPGGDGDNPGGDGDNPGGDGDNPGDGDGQSANCDGIKIGARCVKTEHIQYIERAPQAIDAPNLVYEFDKTYGDNLGALLTKKPMIPANADLGEWYLYNGDYVRIGVAYDSYKAAGGPIADKDRLPQREGRNKDLTWNLNAVKGLDGADLAAPNCTVCHYSYFNDKLIPGLGRNKHFIASDASGFTLDVVGIGLNSVIHLDTFSQLGNALSLFNRLFPDTMHSHLFDLFAALGMRHDPDTIKWTGNLWGDPNSGMKGWIDFPAWWNVKKKNALYSTGTGRGYKSDHMLYMSWFSVDGLDEAKEITNNFVHVQKFVEEKIKAPKFEDFGGKVDKALAERGEAVFTKSCATCHGTYSENEDEETYPNALVDLKEIGTDPNLATNMWIYPVNPWYKISWYGKRGTSEIVKVNGYMAPPLDGVFMTAPYFHNGSVPTLEGVIDPEKRPAVWTSSMSPDDYDWENIGWLNKPFDLVFWTLDQKQGAYYTSDPGNSNQGHTYGAALSAADKKAVLEYLKTL